MLGRWRVKGDPGLAAGKDHRLANKKHHPSQCRYSAEDGRQDRVRQYGGQSVDIDNNISYHPLCWRHNPLIYGIRHANLLQFRHIDAQQRWPRSRFNRAVRFIGFNANGRKAVSGCFDDRGTARIHFVFHPAYKGLPQKLKVTIRELPILVVR